MEWQPFRVQVPASSSNLGPGFDTLSLAFGLHLIVDVSPRQTSGIQWPSDWTLPLSENILDRALGTAFKALDFDPPGLRLEIENPIPLRRGLGSSGAAIIAGIKIAEQITGTTLSNKQILEMAYPLEGHPDNLTASLLGGWVLSWVSDGEVDAVRLLESLSCRFVVLIPEPTVATPEARAILPDSYSLGEAVFNLQRCALLVHALQTGQKALLKEASRDRLHQEYRARLVPGLPALLKWEGIEEDWSSSLLATFISGSGSAVVALVENHEEEIGRWMVETLAREGTAAHYKVLELDPGGARISMDRVTPRIL